MPLAPTPPAAPVIAAGLGLFAASLLGLLLTPSPVAASDEVPLDADAVETQESVIPAPRRMRTVLLPSTAYNPDDGFGAGAFGSIQRVPLVGDPADGRIHVWNLDLVARLWLKPRPTGWELYTNLSWFPSPDGNTEGSFVLSSNGFHSDWWFGTGTATHRDETKAAEAAVRDPWHRFSLYQVRFYTRMFRDEGGPFRVLTGIGVQGNAVRVLEDTLLRQQLDEGAHMVGLDGSVYATVEIGGQIDTRDARLDPTHGGLLTGVAQGNIGQIDGFGAFSRLIVDLRGYLGSPGGEVVLGGEIAAQVAFGEVPFYELGVLAGFEAQPRVLTGITGLRGHDRGRVRGTLNLLSHVELRFRPPGLNLWPRFHARVIPAVWADAARADTPGEPFDLPVVLPGFGGGIRAVFNHISVVRVDAGTGPEFVHTLDGDVVEWPFRLYATVGHAF